MTPLLCFYPSAATDLWTARRASSGESWQRRERQGSWHHAEVVLMDLRTVVRSTGPAGRDSYSPTDQLSSGLRSWTLNRDVYHCTQRNTQRKPWRRGGGGGGLTFIQLDSVPWIHYTLNTLVPWVLYPEYTLWLEFSTLSPRHSSRLYFVAV